MRVTAAALLALALVACGGAEAPARDDAAPAEPEAASGSVSPSTFAGDWPLTAESGVLACEPVNEVVLRASDGETYALNGSARGSGRWEDGRTSSART